LDFIFVLESFTYEFHPYACKYEILGTRWCPIFTSPGKAQVPYFTSSGTGVQKRCPKISFGVQKLLFGTLF
jgi:hypothetical protein